MAVTAAMVRELREMTGAGMMDCKKALAATDGDMDKAVEFLREKGLAGAEKKAGRIAAEGIVATAMTEDEKKAVVVEVNAETDFVAKNAKFQAYVAQVAAQALTTTAADMDAFMEEKWAADETLTVKEALSSQISIIGENMNIRRFKQVVEENGVVVTALTADEKKAVVVEVNAETDFVAKNEKFQTYAADVAAQALKTTAADMDAFMAEKWEKDPTLTVKEALSSQISIIGENMNIRRFEQVEEADGFVASYIHGGGKIGVLVDVVTDVVNDAVKEMARNVAMQIAALKPQYTSRNEISADFIEHEKGILMAQIQNDPKEASKPAKVIEGMINGRINKEMKEICLLDQVYVKAEDGKQSVAQYVAQVAKENGANITVKRFVRFETGEGMEKKNEDFAAEVAKQMGK